MRKFVLLFCLTVLFCNPAFADDSPSDNSNWGIQHNSQAPSQPGEAEEAVWKGERDESIYENYGNQDSSSYLDRQNIDVYDSNHGGSDFDLAN